MVEIQSLLLHDLYAQAEVRFKEALRHRMSYLEHLEWRIEYNRQREWLSSTAPIDRKVHENIRLSFINNPRFLIFYNPHEFIILKRFFRDPQFNKNLEHESDHLNAARERGLINPFIGVFFYNDYLPNLLKVQYFTHLGEIPARFSDEDVFKAFKEVAAAPSWLSEGDTYLLK